jgi:rubrerythrin
MDTSTAIFTDGRVRQRELQVTARLDSKSQLEIIRVQSIKEGKLYNLYYFCEICNITAYAPGPCPCCGNELEFREIPI